MKRRVVLATAVLVGLLFANHPRAEALDLTGTWEGTKTCTGIDDGAQEKSKDSAFLEIRQDFNTIIMFGGGSPGPLGTYRGVVTATEKNPDKGTVTFIECNTDFLLPFASEMVFANVTLGSNGKGTLKGSGPLFITPNEQYTCKWSFKRVSTDPPEIDISPCEG